MVKGFFETSPILLPRKRKLAIKGPTQASAGIIEKAQNHSETGQKTCPLSLFLKNKEKNPPFIANYPSYLLVINKHVLMRLSNY